MLFSHMTPVALICALVASALGAVNTKQTVDGMNALHKSVIEAREGIEGWNGGITGIVPITSKVQSVQNSAADARRSIDQSDAFEDDDLDAIDAAYWQLQPEIVGALNAAEKKAPAFKEAGLALTARTMIEDLRTEKDKFETAMQGKIPAENYHRAAPSVAEVNAAFDNVHKALSA